MKDIYDLLNEIDVDIENMNIEEMETNDIEKIKVLNNVKSKIKSKKKNKRRKGIAIASVLAIGVITLNLFVSKNSILASDIPIIQGIFNMFGYGQDFEKEANKINLYQENEHGRITITEALFDGKNIFLAYTIKLNEPSDDILYDGLDLQLNNVDNKALRIGGGSSGTEKIDDYTYVGTTHRSLDNLKDTELNMHLANNISIKANFEDLRVINFDNEKYKEDDIIYNIENGKESSMGSWSFDIDLQALDSDIYNINKSVVAEDTNIDVTIDKVRKSPIGFEIRYIWDIENLPEEYKLLKENRNILTIMLKAKDDLGNEYEEIALTTSSVNENKDYGLALFNNIDKNAKKLYVTPYYGISSSGGEVAFDANGNAQTVTTYETPEDYKSLKGIELDTIEIDLKNLKYQK